jgi:glycine oxidase
LSRRIIIVGGGVIGLSIAEQLLRRGITPIVLDRGVFAKEASWAGAGFLDLRSVARVGGALFELCKKSYDLFPEWTAQLKKDSGVDPEYQNCGSYDAAFTESEESAIHQMETNLKTFGLAGRWLTPEKALALEPQLSPQVRSVFSFEHTSQVNPPPLSRALLKVLQNAKADLREFEQVDDFLLRGKQFLGVRTNKGVIDADGVVIATGAWSAALAEKLNVKLVSKPYRGQVVMYRGQPKELKHIIFNTTPTGITYLVPRMDGHVYAGSTIEDVGFDKSTTPEGLEKLKTGAVRLMPGLAQHLIEETWAGLRPGSIDGWPYLGPVTGLDGVWVATGHYTHGISLSAVTGQVMAQLVSGERPSVDLAPFAINRAPHPASGL